MPDDGSGIDGQVEWVLTGPDGKVKDKGRAFNVITTTGDSMYADKGAGIAGAPGSPTGMKLGTGAVTAGNLPAKTGTGAVLAAYLANSHQAIATPTSTTATVRVVTYSATYAAGKATSASAITEAIITNEGTLADATNTITNTISRVALSPSISAKA